MQLPGALGLMATACSSGPAASHGHLLVDGLWLLCASLGPEHASGLVPSAFPRSSDHPLPHWPLGQSAVNQIGLTTTGIRNDRINRILPSPNWTLSVHSDGDWLADRRCDRRVDHALHLPQPCPSLPLGAVLRHRRRCCCCAPLSKPRRTSARHVHRLNQATPHALQKCRRSR